MGSLQALVGAALDRALLDYLQSSYVCLCNRTLQEFRFTANSQCNPYFCFVIITQAIKKREKSDSMILRRIVEAYVFLKDMRCIVGDFKKKPPQRNKETVK